MKKLIKEIIINKLFIAWMIFSVFSVLGFYINYQTKMVSYDKYFMIEEYKTIEEMKANKESIIEKINKLDKTEKDYSHYYKNLTDTLRIYESLEEQYLSYEQVYENISNDYYDDEITFMNSIRNLIFIVSIITIILLIYIIFTREFDFGMYIFKFANNKRKIELLKKFSIVFLTTLAYYLIVYGLCRIVSINFKDNYNYVLIMDRSAAHFIGKEKFLFKYVFILNIYTITFFMLFLSSIAILGKKTLKFILYAFISFIVFGIILFITPLPTILGMEYDLVNIGISLNAHNFTKLFIVLPVIIFIIIVYRFEKVDL